MGTFGAVMSEAPINGKWQVVFSEFYTGRDIADILVSEEDLRVHESVPLDRAPKKRLLKNEPQVILGVRFIP